MVLGGRGAIETDESQSDRALMVAARTDQDAFGLIFDRYFREILRYAERRVGLDTGREIAAETFTVALDRVDDFDHEPEVRPCLYGIATNLIRRRHRDQRRQLAAYSRASSLRPWDDGQPLEAVEDALDSAALVRPMALALLKLRQVERDVLFLHAWGGLSYEEIAKALEIPVGSVRSRLSRARAKLRTSLDVGSSRCAQDGSGEMDG